MIGLVGDGGEMGRGTESRWWLSRKERESERKKKCGSFGKEEGKQKGKGIHRERFSEGAKEEQRRSLSVSAQV